MTQLQKTYKKYRDEFEKLEELTKQLYQGNPFQYEQAISHHSDSYYGRDGKIHRSIVKWNDGKYAGMKDEPKIAPPEKKKKIDAYWEQRDKVNELLLNDKEFQKFVASKDYDTGGIGLDALFWISFFAIKNKIYPLNDSG